MKSDFSFLAFLEAIGRQSLRNLIFLFNMKILLDYCTFINVSSHGWPSVRAVVWQGHTAISTGGDGKERSKMMSNCSVLTHSGYPDTLLHTQSAWQKFGDFW